MSRIIINVTDDSIGCENRPADTEVEIRDYREPALREADLSELGYENGIPYVKFLFDRGILEIWK